LFDDGEEGIMNVECQWERSGF